jgi:hypothetical protein
MPPAMLSLALRPDFNNLKSLSTSAGEVDEPKSTLFLPTTFPLPPVILLFREFTKA